MAISKLDKFAKAFMTVLMTTCLIGMIVDLSVGNFTHMMSWIPGIFFGTLIYKAVDR